MPIAEIFISHTHADAEIAHALSGAIKDLFSGQVETKYSTSKELDGGIKPGEEWFAWIVERVRSAEVAVILLTPASTQKPWVLWEAGAVYGAGVASADANRRKVRPLVFKLSGSQVPTPFANIQGINGDERSGIQQFLSDLIDQFQPRMDALVPRWAFNAGRILDATIETYLGQIQQALRNAPLLPTEAAVQEWCDRIDKLVAANRPSEIGHLHDWLNLTFGRGHDERALPLDLRLHRRLGEAYAAGGRPARAAEELQLALEFAPRDIFLLRKLGSAYLDCGRPEDVEQAAKVVERIADLAALAFRHNVECAALKGRLLVEQGDLDGASAIYLAALNGNPDSYYLADVLGQTLLRSGDVIAARRTYRRAVDILDRLAERNVWTHATRATAAIVAGDADLAARQLAEVAAMKPAADVVDRIDRGLQPICEALQVDSTVLDRWRATLRGTA